MKIKLLKNYFVEIWLLFITAIAVTMVILSLFLYKSFEASTVDTINRLNQDFLRETARTNAYVRRTIRISGMELYSEPSIRRMMTGQDLGNFEVVTGVRRLDSVASMGRFIHSIYVYNAATEYMYATSNMISDSAARFEDRGIVDLLSAGGDLRGLIPLARYATVSGRSVPVHTFVFSSPGPPSPGTSGALVINVTLDWLGEIVQQGESVLFVVDSEGTVIYSPDRESFLRNLAGEEFVNRVLGDKEMKGSFVADVDGRRSLVLFTGDEDLYFIRVFAYDAIMENLRRMQRVTLIAVVGVLVFGALVAYFLSRFLYRPIGRIVRSVGYTGENASLSGQSELGYLSTAIQTMVARTASLETAAKTQVLLLRQEVVKELLLGEVLGNSGIAELFTEYGIGFRADGAMRMLAVRQPPETGSWAGELPEIPESGKPDYYACAVSAADVTVFLLQGNYARIEKMLIRRLRRRGARAIAGRDVPEGAAALPAAFSGVSDTLKFGFLYKPGQVVEVSDRISRTGRFEYPTGLEKQILHLVRAGDSRGAEDLFRQFLQDITGYRFDHFRFSLRRLYVSLQLLVREMHPSSDTSSVAGIEDLPGEPAGIDEIAAPFIRLFDHICGLIAASRSLRHREMADMVRKLITDRYADPNLSLQRIADQLNYSSSYISRVFKEVERVSVADAINDHRLKIARSMLAGESTPVREIAVRVGFANENYFFTLFRKKVGITPAAYRRSAGTGL